MSVQFESSQFANQNVLAESNIKINITRHCDFCCATKALDQDEKRDDSLLCLPFFWGVLYNLFSGQSSIHFHQQKKSIWKTCTPSLSKFLATSVSRLVDSLLDCQLAAEVRPEDAYTSLEVAIGDLQLLLKEPIMFLFDTDSSKLYGRNEVSALSTFSRVAFSGKSEALMIGGYSGSGKTRLVLSAVDSVVAVNGILVAAKFEEIISPLTVVLSAFNDLKMSAEEGQYIFEDYNVNSNLPLLISTLPNVLRLAPPQTNNSMRSWSRSVSHGSEVNFFSLCDIITRFMRIVSSQSCPILLALDDCQWSDSASLGIVHAVLSDKEGASAVLFVGTYRDNIPPTHIVFGFSDWLSSSTFHGHHSFG
ncbi:LOW QUALITY PROTEIN: hypothetical protein ACHAWO_000510 [Cyclotella atomus]|uniref:Orc1-like AAA ATPase domain-containing protein n=1 Tax=Cyclotella atomus TaxID=382360 RepID=A0ABD3Q0K2_9STRA